MKGKRKSENRDSPRPPALVPVTTLVQHAFHDPGCTVVRILNTGLQTIGVHRNWNIIAIPDIGAVVRLSNVFFATTLWWWHPHATEEKPKSKWVSELPKATQLSHAQPVLCDHRTQAGAITPHGSHVECRRTRAPSRSLRMWWKPISLSVKESQGK